MINMMLGGIRKPSVPDAAIVPHDYEWRYRRRIMVGSANAVITVTDAPIMPVIAAKTVPMIVTAKANDPGTLFKRTCTQ